MKSNYLGKKLAETYRKSLDQNKINRLWRQIEELKLKIIDYIESGEKVPLFDDIEWLYDLQGCNKGYHFIWNDFSDWISYNGLSYSFDSKWVRSYSRDPEDDSSGYFTQKLRIYPSKYTDYSSVEEPDTTSWIDNLTQKNLEEE